MDVLRRIIREEVEKVLNEGRFDKFTGDIVDLVWGTIRHSKKEKNKEAQYHLKLKEPLSIELFIYIIREKDENIGYEASANTIMGTRVIEVTVEIFAPNKNMEHLVYSDINAELNNVIRHELEHITQQRGINRIPGRVKPISAKQREKAEGTVEYFLSRDEIPALVAGFYRKAKHQKKPIDDVADEFLEYFTGEEDDEAMMNREEKNKAMGALMNYAKKNYPKAVFSKNW